MDRVGIKFLRGQTYDFVQSAAERKPLTVGALAGHGIERVGQANDAHWHRDIFEKQTVGIAGAIAALVMPAYDVWNAGPGELYPAYNLMSHNRVICHFAKFFSIQRRWFAEETLIHGDLPNIVQVTGGA